jgi:hypothetical protein
MALAPSHLPDSRSSLTKYIWLKAHYELLKSIENDTTVERLKADFDHDIVATARKRYLTEEAGVVRRDKLIDLIQEEGAFTLRVKMVMYFLFLFRDPRYRSFICEKVAGTDGRWDASIFHSETGSSFSSVGGIKAFTNLRQLLVQADLLDEGTFTVKVFPALSSWLPDAIEIAAAHIEDAVAQQAFLSSPQAFLIKYGLQGLLNTTAGQLAKVDMQIVYEESADQLPVYPPSNTGAPLTSSGFKTWKKSAPPKKKGLEAAEILSNPALLERANGQHFLLEEMMAAICNKNGHTPIYNAYIDLFIESNAGTLLFEMKSCTISSTRSQIRRAISQVFEYSYLYRDKLRPHVQGCIVVERKPRGADQWLIKYVEFLGVGLVWKRDGSDEFRCTQETSNWLARFLSDAGKWAV